MCIDIMNQKMFVIESVTFNLACFAWFTSPVPWAFTLFIYVHFKAVLNSFYLFMPFCVTNMLEKNNLKSETSVEVP